MSVRPCVFEHADVTFNQDTKKVRSSWPPSVAPASRGRRPSLPARFGATAGARVAATGGTTLSKYRTVGAVPSERLK